MLLLPQLCMLFMYICSKLFDKSLDTLTKGNQNLQVSEHRQGKASGDFA